MKSERTAEVKTIKGKWWIMYKASELLRENGVVDAEKYLRKKGAMGEVYFWSVPIFWTIVSGGAFLNEVGSISI